MLDTKTINCYTIRTMKQTYYRIELHATGFKFTNKFSGFDSANAFFSTNEKPATKRFVKVMMRAIKKIGEQNVSHGWVDYAIGKLFYQDGWEPVSVMSPEWEYRTPTTMSHAVWKEVE